jgi:hypothetical protein
MDGYERRCRLLLRAYPRRYRETRGAEVLGTLLDLAEPGQRSPSPRDSFDVVRGGVLTRLREHPPFKQWLLYRVFGKRLPAEWRAWTRDDIFGWGLLLAQAAQLLTCAALTGLALGVVANTGWNASRLLFFSALMIVSSGLAVLAGRRWLRREWLCRQGFHPDGSEPG